MKYLKINTDITIPEIKRRIVSEIIAVYSRVKLAFLNWIIRIEIKLIKKIKKIMSLISSRVAEKIIKSVRYLPALDSRILLPLFSFFIMNNGLESL